ncbi:MAG: zf-HC2 domain-containing protein [Vicinamibacterales bacterium]
MCTDNKESLIAFVYGELPRDEQRALESHLAACEACRAEVSGLRAVRDDLLAWAPPECRELPSTWIESPRAATPMDRMRAWMPAFGLAAAAMLVLAVSAAIANLDVRYDEQGLVIRTGRPAPAADARAARGAEPVAVPAAVVTAGDLVELEARLRRTFDAPDARGSIQTAGLSADNPQLTRAMRRLIEESEGRVRQEMAARLLDIYNEWDAARRNDLARVQQVLGQVQTRTGAEMAQTRDAINRLMLVSQGQPPR